MSSQPAGLQRFNSYNRTMAPKNDHDINADTTEVPEQALNIVDREDVPPNGGYGWICTACVFLMNAHTWGVNSAWAVFLSYYLERSTFPGTSQFEYALIGGLSIALACLSAPLVAISLRLTGTNITMAIGTLLFFASLLAASFATQIWHLFLSQGVCFGLGMGFLYMPATAVLPQWFSTKRSLAVGLAASGAGFGGVVYNILTGALAQKIGLPWTYRTLAFCSLVANGACSVLIRDRNKIVKPRQESFDWREFKHIEVIFIVTWGIFCELGYVILLFSLPHYATTIGLSQSQGSIVGAMLSVGLGLGRPLVGYFSDRWGRINIAALMTLSCGVFSLALWVPARSYGLLLVFSVLAGFGCGTFWGTTTSVTAEVVGLQRLPTVFGVILISCAAPTTFAEPIGLQLVAASGYRAAQVFVGLMFIFAAGSVWCLRSWKILQIEEKARREQAGLLPDETGHRFRTGLSWLSPKTLFKFCRV